jgi:hypothetical protein
VIRVRKHVVGKGTHNPAATQKNSHAWVIVGMARQKDIGRGVRGRRRAAGKAQTKRHKVQGVGGRWNGVGGIKLL